jgi:hemin uptake protein HemP
MCIVGNSAMTLEGADALQDVAQGSTKDAIQDASQVDAMVYVTEGNLVSIQLTNTESNIAKRADIYDVTGKLVKSVRLVEGMNTVAIEQAGGIYMLRLVQGTQTETHRVFIQK